MYRHLEGHGVSLYPYDRAWEDLRRLRAGYLPNLRATIEVLLVPPAFRNHATPCRWTAGSGNAEGPGGRPPGPCRVPPGPQPVRTAAP
jgi:hypothetical protein